jgi:hypothetical protein
LATRAVYSFTGFPGTPVHHLYLHHDGYPTGAAWRFASALRHHTAATAFLTAFQCTQPQAEVLSHPDQAADAEYRYAVTLQPGPTSMLQVQCWRRHPGHNHWSSRCGPMALLLFIERFLPAGLEP